MGHDVGHFSQIEVQHRHHLLWVQFLRERAETSQVGHQNRNRPLLAPKSEPFGRGKQVLDDVLAQIAAEGLAYELIVSLELHRQAFGLLHRAFSRQLGLDTSEGHGEVNGLGDVVVGSELECADDILSLVFGGRHDDGKLEWALFFADFFENVVAADFWHHDVEQNDVEVFLADHLERFGPALGDFYVVAALS